MSAAEGVEFIRETCPNHLRAKPDCWWTEKVATGGWTLYWTYTCRQRCIGYQHAEEEPKQVYAAMHSVPKCRQPPTRREGP